MKNKKQQNRKYHWHAAANSGGMLELSLYFPDKKRLTKKNQEKALASGLVSSYEFMLTKGYLPPEVRFMSPSDISKKYGKTRQYWEKLLDEGKIPYKETSAGRITTNLWVQGYVNNKEKVDEYVRCRNSVLKLIDKTKRKNGTVMCSKCKKEHFEFHININGNINGICRVCDFHIYTI